MITYEWRLHGQMVIVKLSISPIKRPKVQFSALETATKSIVLWQITKAAVLSAKYRKRKERSLSVPSFKTVKITTQMLNLSYCR